MNDIYGRVIPASNLPIQKAILASSERTGVRLLDCGEGFEGRYEVSTGDVLVACTDNYARAREYYFNETARITAECQAAYNARSREAESAGLTGYLVRDYANGRVALDDALAQQNTPRGIPIDLLPANSLA